MSKLWLLMKKYWFILAGIVGWVVATILLRKPTTPVVLSKPQKPEDVEVEDFVAKMNKRKKEVDDEIERKSRSELIDSVNKRFS